MSRWGRQVAFGLSILVCPFLSGCGGSSGGGGGCTTCTSKSTPTVAVTPGSQNITVTQSLTVTVTVSGASGTPTGSVTLSSGAYSSAATTLTDGSASISIPAGSLVAGADTLTATYTPDAASSSTLNSASGTGSVTVTKVMPTVAVAPAFASIFTTQSLSVMVTVSGGAGNATPTGSITLTSGSYTSAATTLSGGNATIVVPAGALALGTDTLTGNYLPDAASSSTYSSAPGTSPVTVNLTTPSVTVTPGSASVTTTQSLSVTVSVSGGAGNPTPTGTVTVTGGSYTSAVTPLVSGSATVTFPATSLAAGTDTLAATYIPDAAGSTIYSNNTGTGMVTVNLTTPNITVTPGSSSIYVNQSLSVTVAVSSSGSRIPSGSVTLASGSYTSASTPLSGGSASITIPANSLASGSDTLTASYTPDTSSSSTYAGATGTGSVTVNLATPVVLTVDSVAPSSGITITASPADNNSNTGGTTPFTLTYNGGTQVTLTAAISDDSYTFESWSGCTSTSGTSGSICSVTVNSAMAVTATYSQPGVTSITVTPNSATIGTEQQFTATVHGNGSYTSGVTWSVAAPAGSSLSPGDISSSGLYNTPYPAPPTVTVTATSTMTGFTNVSGSATVTLSPPATATGPALTVDVGTPTDSNENPHTISPYVYGMNAYALDPTSEKTANPGVLRWGGDDTSRYNYQNGWTNSASDYYFENGQGAYAQFPNSTSGTNFTTFFPATDAVGAAALGTVPVNGWVSNGVSGACSFTESQFPSQQSYNGDCGNGVLSNGTDLNGNSGTSPTQIPDITSTSEPPPSITASTTPPPGSSSSTLATWADGTWSGGWVNSIVSNPSYGNGASGKGVAIWDLDNEPTWWDAVHRDVHPVAFTYDEVTDNGLGTALAIKTADPTALVSGPVIDYWWAYFYSKKDIEAGWSTGPCYQPWSDPADRTAHGGVPMIEYYLQQFNSYSQTYGIRLLDYVDIHGYFAPDYPAGSGDSVAFTTAGDTQVQQARMNSTRVFWDPTYTDSSDNYPQPNYSTDPSSLSCNVPQQAPQLIPMLQSWVANDYPGTKTAIDEYNFGGLESINGAVVEADILGIFGRQGLDLGAFWPTTNYDEQGPGNYAFAMYRDYDGNNSSFGGTYLYSTSTSSGADAESELAVYGAQRTSDGAITVMVINKTYGSLSSTISLENFTATTGTTAQVFQYSNADLNAIVAQPAVSVTPPSGGGTTSTIANYTFPAQSITLFVVPD